MEYNKALKEQMEINNQKKSTELTRRFEQEQKLDMDIQRYYERLQKELPQSKYDQIPASAVVAAQAKPPQPSLDQASNPIIDGYDQQLKLRDK